MTITWRRFWRRTAGDGQAAATESHEHGLPASDKRRERHEAQLQAKRELSGDPSSPGASGAFYNPGQGGGYI